MTHIHKLVYRTLDSSVGRAEDCRWKLKQISLGHWFESGSREFFHVLKFLLILKISQVHNEEQYRFHWGCLEIKASRNNCIWLICLNSFYTYSEAIIFSSTNLDKQVQYIFIGIFYFSFFSLII